MNIQERLGMDAPLWWYSPFLAILIYGAVWAVINPATAYVAGRVVGGLLVLLIVRLLIQNYRERTDHHYFTTRQYRALTVIASILIPVGSFVGFASSGTLSLVQGYAFMKILLVIFSYPFFSLYGRYTATPSDSSTGS